MRLYDTFLLVTRTLNDNSSFLIHEEDAMWFVLVELKKKVSASLVNVYISSKT